MKTKPPTLSRINLNSYLLSVIVFLLPFEFYPYLSVFNLKIKPIHILLIIFVVINIPILIKNYKKILNYPWIFLCIFLSIATLTTLLNPQLSGFKLVSIYSFEFILAFTISLVVKEHSLKWLTKSIITCSVCVALFAIYQFMADSLGVSSTYTLLQPRYVQEILGYTRVHGFSFEPLFFAWIMTLGLLVNLMCFYFYKKSIYVVSSLIILLSILLSFSKLAFAALVLLMIVLTITSLIQKNHKFTVLILCISLLLIIVAALFIAKFGVAKIQFLTLPQTSTSTSSRLKSYKEATKVIINNPMGVGSSQIEKITASKYSPTQIIESGNTKTNNLMLEIVAENGILATFSLIAFFSCILFYFIRAVKQPISVYESIWVYSAMLFLVASIIFWQVVGNLATTSVWIVIGILLSITNKQLESRD